MFIKILKLDCIFKYRKFLLNFYKIEQKIFNFAFNVTCAVVRFAWEVEFLFIKFAKNIIQQLYLLMKDNKQSVV